MSEAILKFREKYKNEDQIDHVMDFLKAEYGNKNSINFNYEQALEKANLWTQRLNEKNKDLNSSGQVEIVKEFENGFKIVRLVDQTSKDWEGLHMRNCVASYIDHKGIYSLRDDKNYPHCTIEIKDEKIRQIKGKANSLISPKYVNMVLDFLQSLNLSLSTNDMKNLGYTNKIDLDFIKEHFSNYKIIKINDQEFLYVGNKLELIKKFKSKNEDLLLHFCRYNQCFDAIKLLVENGADIHAQNNDSLIYASQNGYFEIVKLLVEKGANVHSQINASLRGASGNGHLSIVKYLVEKGADIHALKNSSLIWASDLGHLAVVKFLVENGADIHAQNNDSLIYASQNGHLEVVKFLVENGANIHSQNNQSLIYARKNGHLGVVKFLVENGSNDPTQNNGAAVSFITKTS